MVLGNVAIFSKHHASGFFIAIECLFVETSDKQNRINTNSARAALASFPRTEKLVGVLDAARMLAGALASLKLSSITSMSPLAMSSNVSF
ncbi:hypothetical protein ASC80_00870 [Afipia sp. Root123D2]|uniref:hypothetical protein n=1 Tax=Afipia sp. Root123D2 TaxID=1736436 RepID=UPI0006F6F8A1|nr:hypothetical protein [Afipia sp. Root123D2]KQW21993.1 hypothetical protein ASC80_00870 [Afipia sp. Root123D2]